MNGLALDLCLRTDFIFQIAMLAFQEWKAKKIPVVRDWGDTTETRWNVAKAIMFSLSYN